MDKDIDFSDLEYFQRANGAHPAYVTGACVFYSRFKEDAM